MCTQISKLFNEKRGYKDLFEAYIKSNDKKKLPKFIDSAIFHRSLVGLRLMADLFGGKIFELRYDDLDNLTPKMIAKDHAEDDKRYIVVYEYIVKRIKAEDPWVRKGSFICAIKYSKSKIFQLPNSLLNEVVSEYL